MKTISVMQNYLFPYLGYYQLIKASDVFVCYDDVNYIKKGWINRNRILDTTGRALMFTAPLKDPSQNRLIKDTLLHESYDQWKKGFLKTLTYSYKKAAQFNNIYPIIEKVLNGSRSGDSISKLCLDSLIEISNYLQISTQINPTSAIYENANLKSSERILDICKQEKATRYINPIGGYDLYTDQEFKDIGAELRFHKIKSYNYKQSHEPFQPHLSIMDALMFCDQKELQKLLNDYDLISNEKKELR